MKNNKGVSLVVLAVIIVIAVILASVAVLNVNDGINDAKLVQFASDLKTVSERVEEYYYLDGSLPIIEDTVMTKSEVISLAGAGKYIPNLENEIADNKDTDVSFYKVDLQKLDINSSIYGIGNSNNDYYVVSDNMNVYYIKGFEVGNDSYFSLSSKLTLVTKIENNQISTYGLQTNETVSGVTVKKASKNWTNKLGILIQASIGDGEELYLDIPQVGEKKIATKNGVNSFNIEEFSDVIQISNEEIEKFNNLAQEEKIIHVVKKKNGGESAKILVNLKNYETVTPSSSDTLEITSNENDNKITFGVSDNLSGIKEVKYEYLKKYDENADIISLYTTDSLDREYLLEHGKKSTKIVDGKVEIALPKNIKAIQGLVIDKAGNMTNFSIDNTTLPIYVELVPEILSLNSAKFKLNINSDNGVSLVKTYLSINNGEYGQEKVYEVNTNDNKVYINSNDYMEITGATESIKIKVEVIDNLNNKKETIVKEFSNKDKAINGLGIDTIATVSKTVNGAAPTYANPIVPVGFKAINVEGASWEDIDGYKHGLVIQDKDDNQFVWVPVDGTNVKYEKNLSYDSIDEFVGEVKNDNLPENVNSETEQIEKYGGFYVARYEACVPKYSDFTDGTSNTEKNITDKNVIFKSNNYIWNNISYFNAKTVAENMVKNNYVCSGMITGTQWDTIISWFKHTGINITNSLEYGNYPSILNETKVLENGKINKSGSNENWKINNIYDMAGNTWEFTAESYNNKAIARGGSYKKEEELESGDITNITYRKTLDASKTYTDVSFRTVLYIK